MRTNSQDHMRGVTVPPKPSTPLGAPARVGVAQRVIATHPDHAGAVRTLGFLTQADFPADRATVVGRGLTFVERGTGQLPTAGVCGRGALSGLVIGGLTGWLVGLVDLVTPSVATWWLTVNTAVLGAVLGAVTALVGYAATRGRRSFTTTPILRASQYDVQVDADLADHAVRLLAEAQRPSRDG